MTEPATAIPNWASAATFTSGPETGLAPTTPFLAGEVTQGMKPGKVVARKLNWLFRTITQWLTYINAQTLNVVDGGSRTLIGSCSVSGGFGSSVTLDPYTLTLGSNTSGHTVAVAGVTTFSRQVTTSGNEYHTGTTEEHSGFELHVGEERHTGLENHEGSVTFEGAGFNLFGRQAGNTLIYDFPNASVGLEDTGSIISGYLLYTTFTGNWISLIVGTNKKGATVSIKNAHNSTQTILVKDHSGSVTMASLAPGQSTTLRVYDVGSGVLGFR